MRTRERAGGFSLLDVLIAIMLVGIIAAAVVPMIGDYSERAMLVRNYANLQEIGKAMTRYDLVHQAPLGYVYDSSQSPAAYVQYRPEDAIGFWRQLMNPTDANGNVLRDAVTASSGPFAYGPYLRGEGKAASLLLAAGETIEERRSGVIDAGIEFNPDNSADLTMTFTPSKVLGGQDPRTLAIHMISADPTLSDKVASTFAEFDEVSTVGFWTTQRSSGAGVVIRVGSSALVGQRPEAPVYCTAPVLEPLGPASVLLAQGRSSEAQSLLCIAAHVTSTNSRGQANTDGASSSVLNAISTALLTVCWNGNPEVEVVAPGGGADFVGSAVSNRASDWHTNK